MTMLQTEICSNYEAVSFCKEESGNSDVASKVPLKSCESIIHLLETVSISKVEWARGPNPYGQKNNGNISKEMS